MAKKRNYKRPDPAFYLVLQDVKTGHETYKISCPDKEHAVWIKGAMYRLFHYKLKKDWFSFEVISKEHYDARMATANTVPATDNNKIDVDTINKLVELRLKEVMTAMFKKAD